MIDTHWYSLWRRNYWSSKQGNLMFHYCWLVMFLKETSWKFQSHPPEVVGELTPGEPNLTRTYFLCSFFSPFCFTTKWWPCRRLEMINSLLLFIYTLFSVFFFKFFSCVLLLACGGTDLRFQARFLYGYNFGPWFYIYIYILFCFWINFFSFSFSISISTLDWVMSSQ